MQQSCLHRAVAKCVTASHLTHSVHMSSEMLRGREARSPEPRPWAGDLDAVGVRGVCSVWCDEEVCGVCGVTIR